MLYGTFTDTWLKINMTVHDTIPIPVLDLVLYNKHWQQFQQHYYICVCKLNLAV